MIHKKIVSDYGRVMAILQNIVYDSSALPESLLPYSKKDIKDALELEKMITEVARVAKNKNGQTVERGVDDYHDAIAAGLYILEHNFVPDKIALEKNKKMSATIWSALKLNNQAKM